MPGRTGSGEARLRLVAALLTAGLLVVTGKLVLIQGIEAGRYRELASLQRDESITVCPRRGTIFDREGEILAISEDVTSIYATPYLVEERSRTAGLIAEILEEEPAEIEEKLGADGGFVYIARQVSNETAERVRDLELPGLGFVDESKRYYPAGSLASQVIGLVDIDNNGQAGIELQYQGILGGSPGKVLLEKDAAGNAIPGSEKRIERAVDGADIQLTLDRDIQLFTEETLAAARSRYGAKAATAVVMDCNSGEILAMASHPTFEPNERSRLDASAMRNRAVTDVYEPGSALKVLTAAAALEEGIVEPDSVLHVPSELLVADEVFKEATPKPSRSLTFSEIMIQSSNVGTIMAGRQLGGRKLSEYLALFGLGRPTGLDFPGEVAGLVPDVEKWSGTSVATISIGQGISITPLQMVCVVGAVANGGKRVYPHLLKARISEEGVRDMGLGGLGEQVLREDTCRELAGIMMGVTGPGGTGEKAAVRHYSVAGKTGTAAKPLPGGGGYGSAYMATFVGFAPAERPRLAGVVVLDEPSPIWGGETSAPVFSEIMNFSLQHLKVPPSRTPGEEGG